VNIFTFVFALFGVKGLASEGVSPSVQILDIPQSTPAERPVDVVFRLRPYLAQLRRADAQVFGRELFVE
jgi:hypothetical protein